MKEVSKQLYEKLSIICLLITRGRGAGFVAYAFHHLLLSYKVTYSLLTCKGKDPTPDCVRTHRNNFGYPLVTKPLYEMQMDRRLVESLSLFNASSHIDSVLELTFFRTNHRGRIEYFPDKRASSRT